MARLSFSRWPSLFFLISKPHQSAARPQEADSHLLHRSRRKKHPRNRCKIRPMGQKIPTLPRRTRQKPQSAAGVLRLYVSPSKAVDNYSKSMLKPPLLQILTTPGAVCSYFSNCDLSGKSLARKSIAHFRSSSLANCESFIQNNMGLYFSNFR